MYGPDEGGHGEGGAADGQDGAAAARDGDWASQTADSIDRFVETVRSNTSDRLVSVARLVVFGLLAAIMGVTALVLVAVFLIRFVDAYLPAGVWAAELVVGGLFTLGGLFLWQ